MTTTTTSVPEQSLRHDRPVAASVEDVASNGKAGTTSCKPGRIGDRESATPGPADTECAARAWPCAPDAAPPLAWWRTLPSDVFRGTEHLLLLTTLEQITVLHGDADLAAALKSDPAAAIAAALSLMPIGEITLKTDIAMTALLRFALERNATAALVLAQVLAFTDVDHPYATELVTSWLAHGQRYSSDPSKFSEAGKVLLAALRERHRDGDDA